MFAHEYGHDLGLPDLYDTSGNTGGAENSTGFWTLMSSGSNIGDGGPDGIGDEPIDFGAWEKFQLGWLELRGRRSAGKKSEHKLGPAEANTKQAQGLVVRPAEQEGAAHSAPRLAADSTSTIGSGNDLDNSMSEADVSRRA